MPRLSKIKDHLGRMQPPGKENTMAFNQPPKDTITYVTSSGNARVLYYQLLGEVEISSCHTRNRSVNSWSRQDDSSLLLSPEDTIEIGIYLLGLQPHIREVLARKEKPVPQ